MTVQAATAQLRDVGIFQGLSEDEIRGLLEGAERREVAAGTTIFAEGDPVNGFYLVEQGKVVVRKATGGGALHDLATLDAKHVFGEMGLLVGGRPRTASVVATEPSVIWHVPAARFQQMVEQGSAAISKVILNMGRVLAARLDAINKELLKLVEAKGAKGTEKKKLAELASFKEKLYKEWSF